MVNVIYQALNINEMVVKNSVIFYSQDPAVAKQITETQKQTHRAMSDLRRQYEGDSSTMDSFLSDTAESAAPGVKMNEFKTLQILK